MLLIFEERIKIKKTKHLFFVSHIDKIKTTEGYTMAGRPCTVVNFADLEETFVSGDDTILGILFLFRFFRSGCGCLFCRSGTNLKFALAVQSV